MLALRNFPSIFHASFLRPFTAGVQLFGSVPSDSHPKLSFEQKLGLPEKPKRPLTPYIRFVRDSYHKVIHEKGVSAKAATKQLAEEWKKVDEATKKKMMDEFHKEMEEYPKILKNYLNSLSDSQRVKLEAAKVEKEEAKKKRQTLMEERKTGKPTKPANTYAIFVKDNFKDLELPKIGKEATKMLVDKWHSLSQEEKKRYEKKFHAAKQDYEKRMVEWEGEMIRQGKESLVRHKSRPIVQLPKSPKGRKSRASAASHV